MYDVYNVLEVSFLSQQLKVIFSALPKIRQNLLFSATITDALEKVKEVARNKVRKLSKNILCSLSLAYPVPVKWAPRPLSPAVKPIYFFITVRTLKSLIYCDYLQVFMWEDPADVATVNQLEQFYILCPMNVKDSYLVQTVRMFQEKKEKGSIMIFTDTCK